MKILPWILAKITGHSRYLPEIEWSSRSWTHNVFRAYELVFWRRHGIKAEASTVWDNGKAYHYYHSFEAKCAGAETLIRNFGLKWSSVRVYVPKLMTPQGWPVPASPYLFAIAWDVAEDGSPSFPFNNSARTFSHTCTGSNLLLTVGVSTYNAGLITVSSSSYNSVALTIVDSIAATQEAKNQSTELWRLAGPSTGVNTVSITLSGSTQLLGCAASSYSGVNQASPIDSHNTTQSANATNLAATTTVVASNCWLVAQQFNRSAQPSVSPGVIRTDYATADCGMADSNGTVGTGSQSLTFTQTNAAWPGIVVASIAPVAVTNSAFLMFMPN